MAMSQGFRSRTAILLGDEGMDALNKASVAIYGLGGVGAACAMDLVRAGVGRLYVVDFDRVEESNLNRLYFGYRGSIGQAKTEAFSRFAREINPSVSVIERRLFFSGNDAQEIIDPGSEYHADCVDSLNAKANLLAQLCRQGLTFISSMGTAGRLEPERLKLGCIWETSGCPLAKSLKTRLKHMGITTDITAVWSDETPVKPVALSRDSAGASSSDSNEQTFGSATSALMDGSFAPRGRERLTQGSSPFVPQAAGHIMAAWIVRRIVADIKMTSQDKSAP